MRPRVGGDNSRVGWGRDATPLPFSQTLAISGFSVVGRDYWGVFPLRGKLLNVRDAPAAVILKNAEIQNIMKVGLRPPLVTVLVILFPNADEMKILKSIFVLFVSFHEGMQIVLCMANSDSSQRTPGH